MNTLVNQSKRRARNITVFATFLAFMGIGVVDPILPIIAKQIGASNWQVEMLFTAYIFTMALLMIPSGLMASRFGDKRMMVIGLGIVTIFALLCGTSQSILQLSLFRSGWGLGNSMFFATAMTLLIALSNEVSAAVGLYEAAIGMGMAGGPLVGGLLGGFSWRYPFFVTGVLIFAAFLLVIFFVPQPVNTKPRKTTGFNELAHLLTYRPFLQGALSSMFYYYGFFVVLAYSPLVLNLGAIQLGLVFFGWGLCLAYGSAVLSHQLEKKYQLKTLIPYSILGFSFLLVLLFIFKSVLLQIALIIISGLLSGLNNALFTSYVMEISPYERGITSGVYNFVRWLGAAIAPILSGIIGHIVSPHTPFVVASLVMFVAFITLILPIKQTIKA